MTNLKMYLPFDKLVYLPVAGGWSCPGYYTSGAAVST